jgi:uncharacterized protein YprB with RNaseH-like and TPR domain
MPKQTDGPKILFLDIETAPDVVWTWGVYQADAIAIKEHWYILSFAYKWLGEKSVTVKGLCDYKGYKKGNENERQLLADIWKMLDEADIVVAHNGRAFDTKSIVARFIAHGFVPPSLYRVVDTKSDLKRVARFSSNRLEWLCEQLVDEEKLKHVGFKMWRGCMDGDMKYWKMMKEYNAHDVKILEELYVTISVWIPQPNFNLWTDGKPDRCTNPACGSKLIESKGLIRTRSRVYRAYRCKACGKTARDTKSSGGVSIQ